MLSSAYLIMLLFCLFTFELYNTKECNQGLMDIVFDLCGYSLTNWLLQVKPIQTKPAHYQEQSVCQKSLRGDIVLKAELQSMNSIRTQFCVFLSENYKTLWRSITTAFLKAILRSSTIIPYIHANKTHCRFVCLFVCSASLIRFVWSRIVMKLGM